MSRIPFMFKGKQENGKPSSITLYLDGKPYTRVSSDELFEPIFKALTENDVEGLRRLLEVKKSLAQYANGKFQLFADALFYNGKELKNSMIERILAIYKTGMDVTPMVTFLENLLSNPSQSSIDELYLFLEHNSLPVTDDGHFLAYKVVHGDYKDCYSGTMDNSVGTLVQMPREDCNPNRNETCSRGLHFCSYDYVKHMSHGNDRRLVTLKINPRDVVSIPSDYNNSKGRACQYLVLEEMKFEDRIQDDYRPLNPQYNADDEVEEDDVCFDCGELMDDCQCSEEEVDDTPESDDTVREAGKLNEDDVRNIRKALKAENLNLTQIGALYGVHRTQIQRIRDGLAWTHVK